MFNHHYRNVIPLALILLTLLTSCATAVSETEPLTIEAVTLINPVGPLVIPVAGLTSGAVDSSVPVNVQYWKTGDEAIGLLSNESAQFAVLPITTAVNMNAAGLDLALLGVHEWKVFYLIAADGQAFDGWDSLVGKTVYTPESKGQTVDVLTRYGLSEAGITPDEQVKFAYAPGAEIVALFQEGKVDYAALPEPFVTQALAGGKGSIVLDYQDYWSQISGAQNGIPIAGLFVKRAFLDAHPEVVDAVAEAMSASTTWGNGNPTEAIHASAEVLPLPETILQSAMERIKFEYVPASNVKADVLNFLQTMQATYPEGIKQIPGDDFFAR
jgi:NitT/TauT family transport system substrate-binding protein